MKENKKSVEKKKKEVQERTGKLDPNNNKNLPGTRMVKHGKTKMHDDGFEHRQSGETV